MLPVPPSWQQQWGDRMKVPNPWTLKIQRAIGIPPEVKAVVLVAISTTVVPWMHWTWEQAVWASNLAGGMMQLPNHCTGSSRNWLVVRETVRTSLKDAVQNFQVATLPWVSKKSNGISLALTTMRQSCTRTVKKLKCKRRSERRRHNITVKKPTEPANHSMAGTVDSKLVRKLCFLI